MVRFNILFAINSLLPGAKFRGQIREHTKEEYNNLEWCDPREKPLQNDLYTMALKNMRKDIMTEINRKTDEIIEFGMTFSDGIRENVPVHLGVEEQINLDTMDRLRVELDQMGQIVFPYELKVSDNDDGEGNYVTLQNADHLHMFFLSGVGFKNSIIEGGRKVKDTLGNMDRTQMEAFIDPR